jgi:hypothetical protein
MRSLAEIMAPPVRLLSRRPYRSGSTFVVNPRALYAPLDRNMRAKVIFLAEGLERATKQPGRRGGVLGLTGLLVLRALLFHFLGADGRLDPSYAAIQRKTGLCRATIAKALDRLRQTGILRMTRRIKRVQVTRTSPVTGLLERYVGTVQDTSLLQLRLPETVAAIAGRHLTFPKPSSPNRDNPPKGFSIGDLGHPMGVLPGYPTRTRGR